MKISYNWLGEFVDLTSLGKGIKGANALADLLTHRGLEVDEVLDPSAGFESVVTAVVKKKDKHPDADRLSICKVSDGSSRDWNIVCGAQNFKEGDKVALAHVGSELPNGMKLKKGKIRGVESEGMMCSEEELCLADSSEGIMILPSDTKIGKPLARVLGLDDLILEISLTPNRGDCLSHWGVAREVAAALGKKLVEPKFSKLKSGKCSITTRLNLPKKADENYEFWGCVVTGVKIGPSPDWVVRRLESLGSRSINNVVDASNLAMLEFGHPTHAYDLKRLDGKSISIDLSKPGEELPLLDDTEVRLTGDEVVIRDGKKPVALAGVMGGGNSDVLDETTDLFLECALFAPVPIRKAAAKFAKHTDASHRFERGVDPQGGVRAISRLADYIQKWAGGKVSGLTQAKHQSKQKPLSKQKFAISLDPKHVSSLLGVEVKSGAIEKILKSLDCEVNKKAKLWKVTVPSYRYDLRIPEDLVEEVARSVGYDAIPATAPVLSDLPYTDVTNPMNNTIVLRDRAKDALADLGLSEIVQYAFNSSKIYDRFGVRPTVRVSNPLSEEQEVMIPALIPGLLQNVIHSYNNHFGSAEDLSVRIFEIRPTFHLKEGENPKSLSETSTNVTEPWKLALVMTGRALDHEMKTHRRDIDFFDMKAVLEAFFQKMGTKGYRYRDAAQSSTVPSYLHPGQSTEVLVGKGQAGYFGKLHPKMIKALKLKTDNVWVAELDWDPIENASRPLNANPKFKPWAEFPPIERDFSILVKKEINADKITQLALKTGRPMVKDVRVFDTYSGPQVAEGMTSVAVRVIFLDEARSLKESEADEVSSRILATWKKELDAELRS